MQMNRIKGRGKWLICYVPLFFCLCDTWTKTEAYLSELVKSNGVLCADSWRGDQSNIELLFS